MPLAARPRVTAPLQPFDAAAAKCSGFAPALARLKNSITTQFQDMLPHENPGSRWPKTSLAALRPRQRLTPEDFAKLQAICSECSAALQLADMPSEFAVPVSTLSLVMFRNRRAPCNWHLPSAMYTVPCQ